MSNSPAATWPFLPLHPESSLGGLYHDSVADGRIVGAADIFRYEWMYRPTRSEMAKVRATVGHPFTPNWRFVAKSIGIDPEASGSAEIDIREILSRLPDVAEDSCEWLLEDIRSQQRIADIEDAGEWLVLNLVSVRVPEFWRRMRRLGVSDIPIQPERPGTVEGVQIALQIAEQTVKRHYVSNVERKGPKKVQNSPEQRELIDPPNGATEGERTPKYESASGSVKCYEKKDYLGNLKYEFDVFGKTFSPTDSQAACVIELLKKSPDGMKTCDLREAVGGGDVHKRLRELIEEDEKWAKAIFTAKVKGKDSLGNRIP
jgi:hypothetical protein